VSTRVAVFASGGGSNLQALIDSFHRGAGAAADIRIALVITDRENCGALDRARGAGIDHVFIANDASTDAGDVARAMLDALERADVQLIALAGYVRLIPPAVIERYRDAVINIHPALLPSFGGKGMYGGRVHEAVLQSGTRVSGATVHYVDEVYDRGRIIAQWPVPVLPGDTRETLAARVLHVEHLLYPAALEALVTKTFTSEVALCPFEDMTGDAPTRQQVRAALGLH
jgi:phosphoribosylglycinamide formyltransferase-1